MAGTERVGNQPLLPVESERGANAPARRDLRRQEGTRFDERLEGSRALVRSDERSRTLQRQDEGGEAAAQAPLSDEAWLRARTFEELKTLVEAIQHGATDPWALTDLIFYARHPELQGEPLTKQEWLDEWNQISALLVHPTINEVGDFLGANILGGEIKGARQFASAFERAFQTPAVDGQASAGHASAGQASSGAGGTRRYDEVIARAVEWCPGLSPAILKGLLAQESNFNPTVINQFGYAGIAQFGREAAREVGLHVGIAGSEMDERLNPSKAIPAAARLLNIKAQRLSEMAFSRYGQPNGAEFWKFVLAAYNGGEGTITVAMGHAYRTGLTEARAKNLVGTEAVSYARQYASRWENLQAGGLSSPLGLAAARYFPTMAAAKFREIGNYPTAIVARATAARA